MVNIPIMITKVANVTCMEEKKCRQEVLVGKLKGKRQIRRPSRKWEDNIKIHFREIEWKGLD